MKDEAPEVRVNDADSALPPELRQFFERGGSSLLIKGAAGTGKTTLALTLVRALDFSGNFLYVSTRESPVQFIRDHAWIAERFGGHGEKQSATEGESENPGGFVDARLDEPTQLLEKITSHLMDVQSPLVIIDTWDAMLDFAENRALRADARVLQAWAERAGARLVFTMEATQSTVLDGLVEGVLILRQRNISSQRLREMLISKLYGVRIEDPSYFFTLNNAEFRSFRHFRLADLVVSAEAQPAAFSRRAALDPEDHFPIGYPELDQVLGGGLDVGSVLNIEIDPEVNMAIPLLVIRRIIASFALSGNQVRLFPFRGFGQDMVARLLRVFVPRSHIKNVSQLDSLEDGMNDEARPRSPVLCVLDSRGVGEKGLRYFSSLARSSKGATIFVGRHSRGDGLFRSISGIGGSSMRIRYLNGTMFLQSKVPASQPFGLSVNKRSGIPEVELDPVV